MREDSQAQTLVTTEKDRTRYFAHQNCSWRVRFNLRRPLQLVLRPRARPMSGGAAGAETAVAHRSTCDSKLSVQLRDSNFNSTWYNGQSMPRAPLIVPLSGSSQMDVSFITGDAEPSENCERIELNIMVAKAGFCGRNILLHRSSCHLISDRKLETPADLDGTGLRLAAFSDMENVRCLMRDNDLRVNQHPYKRPLDLRDPVRIGVFRCSPSMQAFYWKFSNGSCVAEPFNSTVQSAAELTRSSSPQCASVQAGGSCGIELRFSDCGETKRSLLSFPETPLPGRDPCEALRPCERGSGRKNQSSLTSDTGGRGGRRWIDVVANLSCIVVLITVGGFVLAIYRLAKFCGPDVQFCMRCVTQVDESEAPESVPLTGAFAIRLPELAPRASDEVDEIADI